MVSDHLLWKYTDALGVAIASRKCEPPPDWQPWDETQPCSVSGEIFVDPETGGGAGAMKNCRHCGKLVSQKCSKTQCPILVYGITNKQRVCDTCEPKVKLENAKAMMAALEARE